MPRISKTDEPVFEKTDFSSKIFIYNNPAWNVLYPIVDVIRALRKNTIIGYLYGKGQQTIRTYGTQYNHRMLGYNLNSKNDYNELLKSKTKFIFIFNDSADPVAENLINFSKKNNLVIVCYSNVDEYYHFHNTETVVKIKSPEETVQKMYEFIDLQNAKVIQNIFPDFDIIEPESNKNTSLEDCVAKLKQITINEQAKKDTLNVRLFDPHIAKIKAMEREREQKKTVYPDEVLLKAPDVLSKFFKKNQKKTNTDFKIN